MASFIEVQLFQDTPFYIDKPVHGAIHLHAKNNINDTSKIVLVLKGEERTNHNNVEHVKEIINHQFVQYDYTDFYNVVTHGCWCFPFTLWLPQSLPQSHLLMTTKETACDKY